MNKYIDTEKLKAEIEKRRKFHDDAVIKFCNNRTVALTHSAGLKEDEEIVELIDSFQQEQTDMGEVSDGYHTFNELYYYRMLYNAAFFNLLPKEWVHKSKRHHTGEECFGGGWFIVMANLPTGQVSNHYELKDWDLFKVPEKEFADEWDGHTPQEAAERIHKYLQQEQPAFITDNSLGSPDYERGFSHGRDFQLECDLKKTDQEKVKAFLINKGYPINTNGDIPTYDETFNLVKRAIDHAKY